MVATPKKKLRNLRVFSRDFSEGSLTKCVSVNDFQGSGHSDFAMKYHMAPVSGWCTHVVINYLSLPFAIIDSNPTHDIICNSLRAVTDMILAFERDVKPQLYFIVYLYCIVIPVIFPQ